MKISINNISKNTRKLLAISIITSFILVGCDSSPSSETEPVSKIAKDNTQSENTSKSDTAQASTELTDLLSWMDECGDNQEYISLMTSVFGDMFPAEMKTTPRSQWLEKYNAVISTAKAHENETDATFHLVINFKDANYQGLPIDKIEHYFSESEYTGDMIYFNDTVKNESIKSKFSKAMHIDEDAKTVGCMPVSSEDEEYEEEEGSDMTQTDTGKTNHGVTVTYCGFDYDGENFCTDNRIQTFAEAMESREANFDGDKVLYIFKSKDADIISDKSVEMYRVAVLDKSKKTVTPLSHALGQAIDVMTGKIVKINSKGDTLKYDFSKDSNKMCFTGNIYAYRDSYSYDPDMPSPYCFTYDSSENDWTLQR